MSLSKVPTYNLKVVLKETGIAADTLRAWERRYGIPMPERTPGGHRLYSQRDIHLIKWLIARQAEGLSISRAAELWNELTASGADPLAESHAAGIASTRVASAASAALDALRKDWLEACLAYNEAEAEQILNQAFALYSVEIVVTDVIQRTLHEIGEMWYRGEATVQQEHFTSALARRRLDALIAAAPLPTRKETILLNCPPGEWHSLPLLYLSLLLRRRGWNAVYLGANVPSDWLEETARSVKPALVILASQQLVTAAATRDISRLLSKQGYRVAYGGRIFNQIPELRESIAGEFLGEEIDLAVEQIEHLIAAQGGQASRTRVQAPTPNPILDAYLMNRKPIESMLTPRLGGSISKEDLAVANLHFGDALVAALELEHISYLELDMDWIKNLLALHNIPPEGLRVYLKGYAAALQETMGDAATDIVGWIDGYISRI